MNKKYVEDNYKTLLITDDDLDGVSCSSVLKAYNIEHDLIITNCYGFESKVNVDEIKNKGYSRIFITDIMVRPELKELIDELDSEFELHYIDHHKTSEFYGYLERSLIECDESFCSVSLLVDYLKNLGFELDKDVNAKKLTNFADLITYQDNSIWITEDYRLPWFLNIIYKELGYKSFLEEIYYLGFDVNRLVQVHREFVSKETSILGDLIDKKSNECVKFKYKDFNCSFMRIDRLLKEVGNFYLDEHRDVDILFMMASNVVMACTHKDHIDLESTFCHVASAGGNKGKIMINLSNGDLLSMLIFKLNGELI